MQEFCQIYESRHRNRNCNRTVFSSIIATFMYRIQCRQRKNRLSKWWEPGPEVAREWGDTGRAFKYAQRAIGAEVDWLEGARTALYIARTILDLETHGDQWKISFRLFCIRTCILEDNEQSRNALEMATTQVWTIYLCHYRLILCWSNLMIPQYIVRVRCKGDATLFEFLQTV